MSVKVALAGGLALLAICVVAVMSGSPVRVAATNSVVLRAKVTTAHGDSRLCQGGEVLPQGTSAVRVDVEAVVGPRVMLTALSSRRVLTAGERGSGWTGADVTVPVARVRRTTPGAEVCIAFGPSREAMTVLGERRERPAGGSIGRVRIEYLEAGDRSWWSLALAVARRIGLGRAPSGTWIVLVLGALMVAVAVLASWLAIRELGAGARPGARATREPRARFAVFAWPLRLAPGAAWVCALVACLNAVSWSILSPPFQVPDEPSHFAYVQQLAEARALPVGSGETFSPEEEAVLTDLHHDEIQFMPSARTISSRAQQQRLDRDLAEPLARRGPGDAGTAAGEPPLYYALETIPYELGSGGSLLDRLALMRLLSSLFGGLTALFVFLFAREALPRTAWAWTVAGLGAALAPLLGFMSGAVNPDSLLFAVSAALFYVLARAFRRGLTPRLAAAIGAILAIGALTKLNFLGLVPGAILGLILLALRARSRGRRDAWVSFGIALAIAAIPALLYIALEPSVNSTSLNLVSGAASRSTRGRSTLSEASYVWQLFLPRLPGMTAYFPGVSTWRQLWFNGLVGLYGWADTVFPGWVYSFALAPAALLALLFLRALAARREALRGRAGELVVYATMGLGVLALVGAASYMSDVLNNEGAFAEPRYLLPMLALAGAGLALAARGAGRRWGPVAGVAIVVLVLAHDLFSQLLVISRYYG
jgi:predicted membrane protein DUF2142